MDVIVCVLGRRMIKRNNPKIHVSNCKKVKFVCNSHLIAWLSTQVDLTQRTPELTGIVLVWFSSYFRVIYNLALQWNQCFNFIFSHCVSGIILKSRQRIPLVMDLLALQSHLSQNLVYSAFYFHLRTEILLKDVGGQWNQHEYCVYYPEPATSRFFFLINYLFSIKLGE